MKFDFDSSQQHSVLVVLKITHIIAMCSVIKCRQSCITVHKMHSQLWSITNGQWTMTHFTLSNPILIHLGKRVITIDFNGNLSFHITKMMNAAKILKDTLKLFFFKMNAIKISRCSVTKTLMIHMLMNQVELFEI